MRVAGRYMREAVAAHTMRTRARSRSIGMRVAYERRPPDHHRTNVTGPKVMVSGQTGARARVVVRRIAADEIWQQWFCFRHGLTLHVNRRTAAHGKLDNQQRLYILRDV